MKLMLTDLKSPNGQESKLTDGIAQESKSPAVSVVITTYNRSALILDAIKSVEQQTWTDYELIVVDDGSTDDTRERLQPYVDRIRYLYQPNRGLSSARNTGTSAARGRWLAYLDSDDVWLPAKLERQFQAVSALGEEYGACFTNCVYKGDPHLVLTVFEIAGFETTGEFGPVPQPIRFIMSETFGLCIQSLLVLRSAFDRAGGFDEDVAFAEDKDFIFRLSFVTRISYVSEPLVSIDRTPGVPRLTEFSSQRDDRVCTWHERLLNTMLAHPELVDPEMRRLIQSELIGVYYDWTAAKIMSADMAGSARNLGKLRTNGETRSRILWTLLTRACAKCLRALRNRN
jgi:glycosyltransferase involved in cell wall biosynthesis